MHWISVRLYKIGDRSNKAFLNGLDYGTLKVLLVVGSKSIKIPLKKYQWKIHRKN